MHIKRVTQLAICLWMLLALATTVSVLLFKLRAGQQNFQADTAVSSVALVVLIYILPGVLLLTNHRSGWIALVILCPLMLLVTVAALLIGSVDVSALSVGRVATGGFLLTMLVMDRPRQKMSIAEHDQSASGMPHGEPRTTTEGRPGGMRTRTKVTGWAVVVFVILMLGVLIARVRTSSVEAEWLPLLTILAFALGMIHQTRWGWGGMTILSAVWTCAGLFLVGSLLTTGSAPCSFYQPYGTGEASSPVTPGPLIGGITIFAVIAPAWIIYVLLTDRPRCRKPWENLDA